MRGPAQLASYLATGMIVVGFSIILLAWNGAAELDRLPGQFPYLLSGGMAGLGFVVTGVAVHIIQTLRTLTAQRATQMAELQRHVDALPEVLAAAAPQAPAASSGGHHNGNGVHAPDHEAPAEEQTVIASRGAHSGAATALLAQEQLVVAGRTSYHDATCRLAVDRDDLDVLPRAAAEANHLTACRICNP